MITAHIPLRVKNLIESQKNAPTPCFDSIERIETAYGRSRVIEYRMSEKTPSTPLDKVSFLSQYDEDLKLTPSFGTSTFRQRVQELIGSGITKGALPATPPNQREPISTTTLREEYWPERLQPNYPPRCFSQTAFDNWQRSPDLCTFEQWLERHPLDDCDPIQYAGKNQFRYRVQVKPLTNGSCRLVDLLGKPLEEGSYIYVVSPNGNIYATTKIRNKIHHSFFLDGGAVISAGNISISEDGSIERIDSFSGHYGVDERAFRKGLQFFQGLPERSIIQEELFNTTIYKWYFEPPPEPLGACWIPLSMIGKT